MKPTKKDLESSSKQKNLPLTTEGPASIPASSIPRAKLIFQLKSELTRYKQRDQEWKMMFNILAHDLKEPLLSLEGFTKLLEEPDLSPSERKKYFKVVREAVHSLHNLVGSLQSVSRLNSDKLEFADISLKDILNSVTNSLSNLIKKSKGQIILPKQDIIFKSDPVRLFQVFLNLIANSLKYHRKEIDPIITIRYRKEPKFIRISVKDNGRGIDRDDLQRIFEPFSRLKGTHTEEGLGMGLSIVKRIAESFGGEVKVKSTHQVGTTFTILLPRENPQKSLNL